MQIRSQQVAEYADGRKEDEGSEESSEPQDGYGTQEACRQETRGGPDGESWRSDCSCRAAPMVRSVTRYPEMRRSPICSR